MVLTVYTEGVGRKDKDGLAAESCCGCPAYGTQTSSAPLDGGNGAATAGSGGTDQGKGAMAGGRRAVR